MTKEQAIEYMNRPEPISRKIYNGGRRIVMGTATIVSMPIVLGLATLTLVGMGAMYLLDDEEDRWKWSFLLKK